MLKVMIAEDDLMTADMVEELLVQHGYEVCGIARTVEEAIELGRQHKPDLAVIDMRLADNGLGTEVADRLGALDSIGVLFATGNVSQFMLSGANGHACIAKPYRSADLLRGLDIVAEIVATGMASQPFPPGVPRVALGARHGRRALE
jgi:CheY-like chemotaxis protein